MPSSDDMRRLQKNLAELCQSKFGNMTVGEFVDNTLLLAGSTRGDLIREASEEMQGLRDAVAGKQAEFLRYLFTEFQRVEEDFFGSFAKAKRGPKATYTDHYLGVAFNGFYQSLKRGECKFMARDVLEYSVFASGVYNKKKKSLCWTLLGFTIVELQKKGLLESPVGTPMGALARYKYIGTVLMPDFIR